MCGIAGSQIEEDKSTYVMHDQASRISQDEELLSSRTKEESVPLQRKPQRVTEPSRASASEDKIKGQASPGVQKVLDVALALVNRIPIKNVTSQQVAFAVLETESDRLLCALTMAILVVLSSAGFWIVGSKIFRGFLLFRPLFFVLIANITLIVRRLLPENRRKSIRGDKDANSSVLGDGYAWAEEAGRALELGLMFQNVTGALFMDCSVYATIVVFGLSLFG